MQMIEYRHLLQADGGSYLPRGDSAQDIDDAVGLLLSLLGILLAKQATAAQVRERKPRVTTHSPVFTIYSIFAVQLASQLQCQQGIFPVCGSSLLYAVVRWT